MSHTVYLLYVSCLKREWNFGREKQDTFLAHLAHSRSCEQATTLFLIENTHPLCIRAISF
jgi:hypothetical protein